MKTQENELDRINKIIKSLQTRIYKLENPPKYAKGLKLTENMIVLGHPDFLDLDNNIYYSDFGLPTWRYTIINLETNELSYLKEQDIEKLIK